MLRNYVVLAFCSGQTTVRSACTQKGPTHTTVIWGPGLSSVARYRAPEPGIAFTSPSCPWTAKLGRSTPGYLIDDR